MTRRARKNEAAQRNRARNAEGPVVLPTAKINALVNAALAYAAALRRQDELFDVLQQAPSCGEDAVALREHSTACEEVDATEHALLSCAANTGRWAREDAEESV